MKLLGMIFAAVVLGLAGVFGFSYVSNPDMPVTAHASAVGDAMANPLSGKSWRGLACPHRSVVTDLVTKSVARELCGAETDGGAMERAERFRTEGPTSCWALFDNLSQQTKARFAPVLSGQEKPGPAAQDICRQAKKLIEG